MSKWFVGNSSGDNKQRHPCLPRATTLRPLTSVLGSGGASHGRGHPAIPSGQPAIPRSLSVSTCMSVPLHVCKEGRGTPVHTSPDARRRQVTTTASSARPTDGLCTADDTSRKQLTDGAHRRAPRLASTTWKTRQTRQPRQTRRRRTYERVPRGSRDLTLEAMRCGAVRTRARGWHLLCSGSLSPRTRASTEDLGIGWLHGWLGCRVGHKWRRRRDAK